MVDNLVGPSLPRVSPGVVGKLLPVPTMAYRAAVHQEEAPAGPKPVSAPSMGSQCNLLIVQVASEGWQPMEVLLECKNPLELRVYRGRSCPVTVRRALLYTV